MANVLVVDDEHHIRLLIEQTLEELGDEGVLLLSAPDGEAALEAIRVHRPALTFLDVMMPKMNGYDVCRTAKAELGADAGTIVLLTARGQALDRERGLAAGADAFMTKPFDPDRLLGYARGILGLA